jgi:hypothetical protein
VGAQGVIPDGEGFRRAVAWLLERPDRGLSDIELASQRFDLSPLEAAILFRYFAPGSKVDNFQDQ